jgi:hypothetical protein
MTEERQQAIREPLKITGNKGMHKHLGKKKSPITARSLKSFSYNFCFQSYNKIVELSKEQ